MKTRITLGLLVFLCFGVFFQCISVFFLPSSVAAVTFELPERTFSMVVEEDGSALVEETVTWLLKDPFRYVTWQVEYPSEVDMEDLQVAVLQGPSLTPKINYVADTHNVVSLELWFAPKSEGSTGQSSYVNVPEEGQIVQVKFSYYLRNIMMECNDFSQLFVKFIGEGTAVKTDNLVVMIAFPSAFGEPSSVYVHPLGLKKEVSKGLQNDRYVFHYVFEQVPANTYVEGRFVFPGLLGTGTNYRNSYLSLVDVEKIEREYTTAYQRTKMLGLFYPIVLFIIFLGIYLLYGRERKIEYDALYERDLPTQDPPELVNAIVRRVCQEPDNDGFSAAVLDMVRKGHLSFIEKSGEVVGLKLIDDDASRPYLSGALETIADKEGEIMFSRLEKTFMKKSLADKFWDNLTNWEESVTALAQKRKYFNSAGNTVAKTVAVLGGIALPIILLTSLLNTDLPLMDARTFMIAGMGVSFIMALIVLFMNRAVFSHWTEQGLLYVKQWQALRKYLTDFTLLSQNPPQALTMWDELLVYGTALGVAKQTLENLRQLYPTAPPETPLTGTLYVRPFIVDKLNGIPTTALLSMGGGKSGIGGGGGGFGSGANVGGGAGGSSVGAG
jgi:uncharacterized membrane protein